MKQSFNTFKVLAPEFRETYAPLKLRAPKLAKPKQPKGLVGAPKPPTINRGGY